MTLWCVELGLVAKTREGSMQEHDWASLAISNQIKIKSNQILFKVGNVHLKEKKNLQEAIYLTIFYKQ